MSLLARWEQAVVAPGAAMASADGEAVGGRAGIDLIKAIAIALVVAQTRAVVGVAWIAAELGVRVAMPPLVHALTTAATVPLAAVALAVVVVWGGAGRRRDLGRDVDLACVAALPPTLVAMIVAAAGTVGRVPRPLALAAVGLALVAPLVAALRVARARAVPT